MSGGSYSAGTAWKSSSFGTPGDVRIYPGFDGTTMSGISYGVQVELRTATSNASGAGVNSDSASSSGVDSLYIRRAYAYIGTGNYGYGRFGQGDGAFELLQTGVIDQFGDEGQWHADGGLVDLLPSGRPGKFIYANQGTLYATDKIVYISPAVSDSVFDGSLSVAVGYEPNANGIKEGTASLFSAASALNDAVSGGSATHRQNTWDGMIQYVGIGSGFTTKFSAGYLEGQPLGTRLACRKIPPLSVWQAGGQTTYKGLFTTGEA